ncbi:MAG: hypothetical protein QXU09_01585 [Thermoproteota archaeon]
MHWLEFLRKARSVVDTKIMAMTLLNAGIGATVNTSAMVSTVGVEKLKEIAISAVANEVIQASIAPLLLIAGSKIVNAVGKFAFKRREDRIKESILLTRGIPEVKEERIAQEGEQIFQRVVKEIESKGFMDNVVREQENCYNISYGKGL